MKWLIKKIKAIWNKHEVGDKVVVAAATEAVKIELPGLAVSIEAVKSIFENFNEAQCQMILDGLKKSENVEMRINQLYSYSKKKEGSLIISKLGEQAALSKSTKALVILESSIKIISFFFLYSSTR